MSGDFVIDLGGEGNEFEISLFDGYDIYRLRAASRSKALYRIFKETGFVGEGWKLPDYSKRAVDYCRKVRAPLAQSTTLGEAA